MRLFWWNRVPPIAKQFSRLVKKSFGLLKQSAPHGETEFPVWWNRVPRLVKPSGPPGEAVCPVWWNSVPRLVKQVGSSGEAVCPILWNWVPPSGAEECPLWCSVMNGWRRKCKEEIRSCLINDVLGDKLMLTLQNIIMLKKFYKTSTYFLAKSTSKLDRN